MFVSGTTGRSITGVLVGSLLLVVVVPFLPLAYLTLAGYRDDVRFVEDEIQTSNRQIGQLAVNYLGSLAATLEAQGVVAREAGLPPPDERAVIRWELLDAGGRVVASQLGRPRVGSDGGYGSFLAARAPGRPAVSDVGWWLPGRSPTVLFAVPPPAAAPTGAGWLIGVLEPERLHEQLAAHLGARLDRRVYVVDRLGRLIFYSDIELSRRGEDLRDNPPVRGYLTGATGSIRYASRVTGKERLGFVQRAPAFGWGVVVSADIGGRVVGLRGRYLALLWSILFALAAASAILLWTSRRLTRPVRRIRDAIRRAPPHASLDLEPASLGVLEYADLVRAFNEVAARLAATEAELIQAEKTTLLGQLASGIAHEVGTPLNVISGYAQYLMRRFPDPELHEVLEKIVRQAGRLAEMIRRVLDFARPHPVQLGAVDLGEVVRLALEVSAAALRTPRVDVDLAAGTPAVRGDARLLEHALVNLLVNAGQACHAAPDGGHIEISVGVTPSPDGVAAPTWVYCRVADNGSGIAPEHRDKLFEPFFTTKAQGEGTGLGLAMVERIARQHGGEVDVVSEPGQKTAFTLRLRPALPAEELTPDG